MTKYEEIVLLFDASVSNAGLAIAEIDSSVGGCVPEIIGKTAMIAFFTCNNKEWLEDRMRKAIKVIESYDIPFKKVRFKKV